MVRKFVTLFYKEIKGLHQAAYILAIFAFASQLLAIVRDRMLAHTFGAGVELDIYYSAFRIPDLLFVVFASVLSVYVLIPFVAKARKKSNENAASLLSTVFTAFIIGYIILVIVLYIFTPYFAKVLFPALFSQNPDTLVSLMRILLIQPLFLGISSLFGVITQMQKKFVIYALSPIIYNVGIIIGIVYFYPTLGLQGLGWGVVLGAILHMMVQIPIFVTSAIKFNFAVPKLAVLKEIVIVAIPRAITLSLNQVVLLMLTIFAAAMTLGSVSVFQLAFNLQSVPLTIIGVSYSVAAFPVLANYIADSDFLKFKQYVQTAFKHIIFWALPITALVIILRAHIVRLTLGSGNFNWDDTKLTAALLAVFVVALVFQSINLLIIRAFYANSNTRTPLLAVSISSLFSVFLAYVAYTYLYNVDYIRNTVEFIFRLQETRGTEVIMLPLGYIIGILIQTLILLACLMRVFPGILKNLARSIYTSLLAALLGGGAAYATLQIIVDGINQDTFIGVFLQGATAGVIGVLFIYITYTLTKSPELKEIKSALSKRFNKLSSLTRLN